MPLTAPSRRRFWALALLAAVLLVLGSLAAGLWLAIERTPRVDAPSTAVSLDDVERARQLLRHNDPRRALPGITRAVLLSQRDLELLLQQAGQRMGGAAQTARGRVRLQPGLAVVRGNLGDVLSRLGRDDEAAEAYRQALAAGLQTPELHVKLAQACKRDCGFVFSSHLVFPSVGVVLFDVDDPVAIERLLQAFQFQDVVGQVLQLFTGNFHEGQKPDGLFDDPLRTNFSHCIIPPACIILYNRI